MMAGGILRGDTRWGWLVVRDHGSWRGGVLYEARGVCAYMRSRVDTDEYMRCNESYGYESRTNNF